MRVSEYFKLNQDQPTLDFVNVDVNDDTEAFIDPRALRLLPSEWGNQCVSIIQDFSHLRFLLFYILGFQVLSDNNRC